MTGMDGAQDVREVDEQPTGSDEAAQVDWWHRDHPTFTALTGFFTGMLLVTAVPGGLIGLLRLALPYDSVQQYLGLVVVCLLLPLVLLVPARTRRFGTYMLIGMALTALVVLGVASLVLYLMIRMDG